jgi:hypothetical protein
LDAHRDQDFLEQTARKVAAAFNLALPVARLRVDALAISAKRPPPPPEPPAPAVRTAPPGTARALLDRVLTRGKVMTVAEIIASAKGDETLVNQCTLRAHLSEGRARGMFVSEIDAEARAASRAFIKWKRVR